MKTLSRDFVRNPWSYFGATFLWTWTLSGLLIFTDLNNTPALGLVVLLLAIIGPGVTGILFTYWTRSPSEIRDYWHRVVDAKRLTWAWLAVATGLPFLLHVLAGGIDGLTGGAGLSWGESAPAFIESPTTQLLALFTLTLIPFFEELGWRGYAQDALERKHSALTASLILGCLWSLWHLPASFIPGTYQAGLGVGTREFWLHLGGIVVLSVVVSWIYINTKRSILIMTVFHAMVNLAGELIRLSELGETIYTLCWVSAAIAIAFAFGRTMRVGSVPQHAGRLRRTVPLVIAVGALQAGWSVYAPRPLAAQSLADRFQSELDALREEHGFPGATAAYILPDGTIGVAATGEADSESGRSMDASSTMLAASVGKTFVGATALALVAEGRLGLDDPIANWLGELPWIHRLANNETITVRQLLHHTSGIANHVESESFVRAFGARWSSTDSPMSPEELIAHVLDQPALFHPGEGWSYSDTGYLLMGLIIEEVTGRSYYEEVARRFLAPFSLNATIPSNRVDLPNLATGYLAADNVFDLPGRTTDSTGSMVWNPAVEWTGGGLASNPRDLVRWARVLFEGEAVAGEYLGDLLTPHPLDEQGQVGYGLGVAIHRASPFGTALGHGGWIPGYCTSLRYYADHGIGIAFQINTDIGVMDGSPSAIDEMERRLAAVVIDAVGAPRRPKSGSS